MDVIESLLSKAKAYPTENVDLRIDLAVNGQHPNIALLCCSDSRVIPEEIFHVGLGELFVIRTAGNTLGPNEDASFGYAYHHLGIRAFVVLGHTRCGAIASTLKGEHCCIFDALSHNIGDIADPREASIVNAKEVAKALKEEFPDANVVAWLYDVDTGEVYPL